jgi:methylenetetrahydrofolate dehydrogenase (NADP+)/methenyltetrahydrofolate cyclohydrolase
MKHRACAEVGIASFDHEPPATVSAAELGALMAQLACDPRVSGILLQLPLPEHLAADELTALIPAVKDVDGLTPTSAAALVQGRPGLVPCTPAGVIELLAHADVELEGSRAVVLGRSQLVGRPLAALLLAADATVTQCHSRTRDLGAVCREADVLVSAVGRPGTITAEMVRPGAVVIDVGTNRGESTHGGSGGLVGDVEFEPVAEVAGAITPVPGGVGPMTIAMLLSNTVAAARLQAGAAA